MAYGVGICDDSSVDVAYLSTLVQEFASAQGIELQIHAFASAESFLFNYAEHKDDEILLLDIEMGQMDGVSLAKEIRKENESVQIIFITGYADYIAEGYEVAALHYLMKPVNPQKLFEVLSRAIEKVKRNERVLNLELLGEMQRVPLHDIRWLEVNQNYVTIHAKRDYTIKKTLSEFEKELDDRFLRIGRSFIVNLAYVRRVTKKDVFLADGSSIPLPRGMYETINRAIIART